MPISRAANSGVRVLPVTKHARLLDFLVEAQAALDAGDYAAARAAAHAAAGLASAARYEQRTETLSLVDVATAAEDRRRADRRASLAEAA